MSLSKKVHQLYQQVFRDFRSQPDEIQQEIVTGLISHAIYLKETYPADCRTCKAYHHFIGSTPHEHMCDCNPLGCEKGQYAHRVLEELTEDLKQ